MDTNTNVNKVVYSVKDIQKLLGISRNLAYELVKSKRFPVRKAGSNYLIPKKGFDNWLNCTNDNLINFNP
jgi:excisionase family DNA binding protein